MYYANCEWYVDMGEHYKPLCERNSLRPAKCSECPVYIGSIEAENAKLRELVRDMFEEIEAGGFDPMVERHGKSTVYYEEDPSWRVGIRERIRELGIEVDG